MGRSDPRRVYCRVDLACQDSSNYLRPQSAACMRSFLSNEVQVSHVASRIAERGRASRGSALRSRFRSTGARSCCNARRQDRSGTGQLADLATGAVPEHPLDDVAGPAFRLTARARGARPRSEPGPDARRAVRHVVVKGLNDLVRRGRISKRARSCCSVLVLIPVWSAAAGGRPRECPPGTVTRDTAVMRLGAHYAGGEAEGPTDAYR